MKSTSYQRYQSYQEMYLGRVLGLAALISVATCHPMESVPLTYGPRPFWLVDQMTEGPLKSKLKSCMYQSPCKSDFSIGHRGACMQFPEHTRESYIAAAQMGAGILECDVTFTKDLELVCRHSQCDLHTTTDILLTPLAHKCTEPFTPAGNGTSASAKCCTSDITLAEFRTLKGKMDASYSAATTAEEYVTMGTANWRTDLYSTSGTLMTHAESVRLFKKLGVKMTPELKSPSVEMPFNGFSQEDYARKLVAEYWAAGVQASSVWLQSFNVEDVYYWIKNTPKFGEQAVYLDGRYDTNVTALTPTFDELVSQGVKIIAPPLWVLVKTEGSEIVQSEYSMSAKEAGLDIITWTIERSGAPPSGWYTQTYNDALMKDGDVFKVIDALAHKVGVLGIFTDWSSTVTYYANCFDI